MNDDLVVVGRERSPEQQAGVERPSFVVAGTGGKRMKLKDGRIIGPFGGELLRQALLNNRGAKVVSEEPVKTIRAKSVTEQRAEVQAQDAARNRDQALMFGR